jgi:acetolactate synthase-1/2/3 large subunit
MNGISELIAHLQQSERPLILMGAGARDAASDIIAFAERFDIPIQTTWNAIDLIPWEHRLFVGRPGAVACRGANFVIQNCDLLIAIGARLDEGTIAYKYDLFAPKAKKVLVDIDRGEALKIPNLDLFIHADAGVFIREMIAFADSTPEWYDIPERHAWPAQCQKWFSRYFLEGTGGTYELVENLSNNLPSDAILILGSSTTAVSLFCAGFRQKKGQRVILSSCGLGSMGATIPGAVGVALASGKHVTVIDGDGSFMQNIQELEVVRRLYLPITFYVINNGGYASIRNAQKRAFDRVSGADLASGLTLPNIQAIADAFRIMSCDYEPGVYLDCNFPTVIEVKAPHDELIIPRVMFDGRGNLGDLWPYKD